MMSKMETDDLDDKPLDPAVEKVRRKMVRLLAVSIGIMMIGLMTVLGAIVYRVTQAGDDGEVAATVTDRRFEVPAGEPYRAQAVLPAGFTVESVALDGGTVLFFGRAGDGGRKAYLFDIAAGRIVADVTVSE
jgi:hypothetical protein